MGINQTVPTDAFMFIWWDSPNFYKIIPYSLHHQKSIISILVAILYGLDSLEIQNLLIKKIKAKDGENVLLNSSAGFFPLKRTQHFKDGSDL